MREICSFKNSRSWLIRMKQRVQRLRKSENHATDGRSRWLVGSSSSSTSGRWNNRPASTARIFQPPENSPRSRCSSPGWKPRPARIASASCSPKNWSKCSTRSCSSATSAARSMRSGASSRAAASSAASAAASRSSSCVRPGTLDRIMSTSVRPPAIEMSCGSQPTRVPAARVTVPSSTSCSPAMILSNVVLPEPFGPINPTRSP